MNNIIIVGIVLGLFMSVISLIVNVSQNTREANKILKEIDDNGIKKRK